MDMEKKILYKRDKSHLRNKAGKSKLNQQEDMFNDQNYCKSRLYAPFPLMIIKPY